jgi:hypothetical protein
MGCKYMSNQDIYKIKKELSVHSFSIKTKIINYCTKRIIPFRLIFFKKYAQTHKMILIAEKLK